MAQQWKVVGGEDKGGILIREGVDLKSPQCSERLSTGALVEQLGLVGERLHYKLLTGTGPAEGWASLKVSGKALLEKVGDAAAPAGGGEGSGPQEHEGGPGAPAPVKVDADLKSKVEADAKKWASKFTDFVMKYNALKYPVADCKMRVICFHNAGSAESVYSAPAGPLVKWAKETGKVEVIAIDFPGRDKVKTEARHVSTSTLSPLLLALLHPKIADGVPYCVWAHSVGTWVAFELLILARKIGLPMPKAAFLNAFPAPHLPVAMRPWPQSVKLDSKGIQAELKNWDDGHFGPGGPGTVIFESDWDKEWEPMMRADFRLYDEYEFKHAGAPPFEFDIHVLHMAKENYNKPEWLEMWKEWTTGKWSFDTMKDMGHLTCWYKPDKKLEHMNKVIEGLKTYYASLA